MLRNRNVANEPSASPQPAWRGKHRGQPSDRHSGRGAGHPAAYCRKLLAFLAQRGVQALGAYQRLNGCQSQKGEQPQQGYQPQRGYQTQKGRQSQKGYQVVQLFGLIAIGLMISALTIDFAYYYTAYNSVHTAADSAALAAATELYRSTQPNPKARMTDAILQAQQYLRHNQPNLALQSGDLVFGYVNPSSRVYNRATFATPTADPHFSYSNGYNGVWVKVNKTADSANGQLNTIMANLIGIHKMNLAATSVAMVDQGINRIDNGGLRPIYACEAQVDQAMQDGILENNLVRVFSDHVELDGQDSTVGCPAKGSGNWSFADFTGCGVSQLGASTVSDWFSGGYRGTVSAGQCYGALPGNFLSHLGGELNGLIAHGTVFPIPIYDNWAGSGNRANLNVNGFVGFKITRFMNSGPVEDRYLEGHFHRYLCNTGCRSVSPAVSRPAGSVVKIRLASRS